MDTNRIIEIKDYDHKKVNGGEQTSWLGEITYNPQTSEIVLQTRGIEIEDRGVYSRYACVKGHTIEDIEWVADEIKKLADALRGELKSDKNG